MNRVVIGWAVLLLVMAIALMASPIPLTGTEHLTPLAEIGVFLIPASVVTAFAGGLAADPSRLTIGGALGNPDEPVGRERPRPERAPGADRRRGSPKEPVNCRHCYTLVPWDVLFCPRCRTPRSCRSCGAELEMHGDTIRCLPCGRWEPTCGCPERPRAGAPSEHTRRRAVR